MGEQGYSSEIIDLSQLLLSTRGGSLRNIIRNAKPDVVGVSCKTHTYQFASELCELAKEINPSALTIMGGVHPTFRDLEVLSDNPQVDLVVRGEGEYTLHEILRQTETSQRSFTDVLGITYREEDGHIRRNGARPLIYPKTPNPGRELDILPSPYLNEAFRMSDYPVGSLLTTRGCPFACAFCVNSRLYMRRVRFHSVERVLQEIQHLYAHDKKRLIFIDDDTFTVNPARAKGILEGIIRLNLPIKIIAETRVDLITRELLALMKRAGVIRIDFGLESGNDETLARIGKGITTEQLRRAARWINELGLFTTASFVIGLPPETIAQVRQTIQFAKSLSCYQYSVNVLQLFPGTELFERAEEYGIVYDKDYHLLEHRNLSQREIRTLVDESFRLLPTLEFRLNKANTRNLAYQLTKGTDQNVRGEAEL